MRHAGGNRKYQPLTTTNFKKGLRHCGSNGSRDRKNSSAVHILRRRDCASMSNGSCRPPPRRAANFDNDGTVDYIHGSNAAKGRGTAVPRRPPKVSVPRPGALKQPSAPAAPSADRALGYEREIGVLANLCFDAAGMRSFEAFYPPHGLFVPHNESQQAVRLSLLVCEPRILNICK